MDDDVYRKTNKQPNATENITSIAKEVTNEKEHKRKTSPSPFHDDPWKAHYSCM